MNADVRLSDPPIEKPSAGIVDIEVVTPAVPTRGLIAAAIARTSRKVPAASSHTLVHTLAHAGNRAP